MGRPKKGYALSSEPELESPWLSPKQSAAYVGVSVDMIYDACKKDLRHVKLGHSTIRIRRNWLDVWMDEHLVDKNHMVVGH
jgi:excisionase family DNA binding protein